MIPTLQDCTVVSVFGPVASGKTFLLKKWAQSMPRVVVFDPTAEWDETDGFEVFSLWEPETGPRAFAQRFAELDKKGQNYKLVARPGNIENSFDWVTAAVWQGNEPRWFVIEEINLLMSPQFQHPMMNRINRFTRKRFMGVIGASQSIADVHKNFTRNSRMSVVFHTTEPRDIEAAEDRFGEGAGQAVSDLVSLDYDDATSTVRQTPEALIFERGKGFEVEKIG